MVDLFYATNVTHLFFREDLASQVDVGNYTYTVYLDSPQGGTYNQDFRLVHSLSGSYLETWDGNTWNYQEEIAVLWDGGNGSLVFEVPVASIGGVGESNVKVWFENCVGADAFDAIEDRAPKNGEYNIRKKAIPNIPLLVLPAFAGGLAVTVVLLRRGFTRAP